MRTIKAVTKLDPQKLAQLGTYAAREVRLAEDHCDKLVSTSLAVWELEVDGVFIGYSGITCESLLADKIFWCLFGVEHTKPVIKAYKVFSVLLHAYYPNVITYVEKGWTVGERFAQFCGFVPTTKTFAFGEKDYILHKRKM
jgi:hypothetical protein